MNKNFCERSIFAILDLRVKIEFLERKINIFILHAVARLIFQCKIFTNHKKTVPTTRSEIFP